MAYLITRKGSKFWWLRYRQEDGVWKSASTKLQVLSERETKQAKIIQAQASLRESEYAETRPGEDPWAWVDGFLVDHCRSASTLATYQVQWEHVKHFLKTEGIRHPRDVKFAHGSAYVAWRKTHRANGRKRGGSKNTALSELRTFGAIMNHARKLDMIINNPIYKLGISRDAPEEKAEFTDEDIERCLAALESRPKWMRLAFTISLHTGCRLRETQLDMRLVDFDRKTITFAKPKGGRSRAFTRPLPAQLLPVLEPFRGRSGTTHTMDRNASEHFAKFFRSLGLSHLTFHGLRVTYITRLARAGVPLPAAMRLVNHASKTVHAIYQRLGVEDVRQYADVKLFATTSPTPVGEPSGPQTEDLPLATI